MNRRGFTLVELLAVIVILSLLALITGTAITNMVKSSKEDLSDIQYELIESAAKAWGSDNLSYLPASGECIVLKVKNLKDYGLLESDLKDPKTNELISNDMKIKISGISGSSGKTIINYEVNPSDVSTCRYAYVQTSGTSDATVPCGVVSGRVDTLGSEIACSNEHFYVLSSDATTVTMLAVKNISGSGPYMQTSDTVTMNYYNALATVSSYVTVLTGMGLQNVQGTLLKEAGLRIMGCTTIGSGQCTDSILYPFNNISNNTWTSVNSNGTSEKLLFNVFGENPDNRHLDGTIPLTVENQAGAIPVITTDKMSIALIAN